MDYEDGYMRDECKKFPASVLVLLGKVQQCVIELSGTLGSREEMEP